MKVDVPKTLTEKQRALLQAYAELESETPGTVNGFTYDKKGSKVKKKLFVYFQLFVYF